MAHFAELDESGTVLRVVVVANAEILDGASESEARGIDFLDRLYGHRRWAQTSYNARGIPAKRYNYASIGGSFDAERNAFIAPRPFASWVLNEQTCDWVAPIPQPQDGKPYEWDEPSQSWVASPNS